MTTPTVEIAGLTFDDGTTVDDDGIRWIIEDLVGWFWTDVVYNAAASAAGDGEVPLEVRSGPRPLTITGFVGVDGNDMWWLAANMFEAAFEPLKQYASPGTLVVHEPTGAKSIDVYVSGAAQLSTVGILLETTTGDTTSGFRFMVPLIAPDPAKVEIGS